MRESLAIMTLLIILVAMVFFLIFGVDWSPQRHDVTREEFNDGVVCYVWSGQPISCEGGPDATD